METMEFKEMTVNDVDEVVKFYYELAYFIKNETADDYFDFDLSRETGLVNRLKESIDKPEEITFIAKKNAKVIAFISGEVRDCFLPISKVKKVGYINGAFVLSGYRNKGIMKKLENMLRQYFKTLGLSYIELSVMRDNSVGKRGWETLGYKTFRELMRKKI